MILTGAAELAAEAGKGRQHVERRLDVGEPHGRAGATVARIARGEFKRKAGPGRRRLTESGNVGRGLERPQEDDRREDVRPPAAGILRLARLGRNGDEFSPGGAPLAHRLRNAGPVARRASTRGREHDALTGQCVGVQQGEAGGEAKAAKEVGVERPPGGGKVDGRGERGRMVEAGAEALAPAVGLPGRIAGGDHVRDEALHRKRQDDVQVAAGGKCGFGDQDVGARGETAVNIANAFCRERRFDARTQGRFEIVLRVAIETLKRAAAIDGDAADRQPVDDAFDGQAGMGADAAELQARGGELAVGGILFARRRAKCFERGLLLAEQQMGFAEGGVRPVALR